MSNKILFVFEGPKTEGKIVRSMQRVFMSENTVLTCVFGADIYQLYVKITNDADLDTFSLIKERNLKENEFLLDYSRNDFAEIYLFFDYDGHATRASDEKIAELLELFNEETEKGKLYVSYPMSEAIRHISDLESFKNSRVACKENIGYKTLVGKESAPRFLHMNRYNESIWKELLNAHLKKANQLVWDDFELPKSLLPQKIVFSNQLQKYILPYREVSVLSAFPLFIHDYFGNDFTISMLSSIEKNRNTT